ncbi:hypothetical protein STVA_21300 [Allostella vacuolata]|nr:hypothetical protein STVA_21300 [Stella vacuolata]
MTERDLYGIALPRAAPAVPPIGATRPEDVYGCLRADAAPIALEEMDAAVLAAAERSHCGL